MDGDTVTPTPEPGQRYLLEAECVPSVAGHPMLTPITADGQPSTIRLAAARYRWQPADVPPQPPVLAFRSVVRLEGDDEPWEVYRWWSGPEPTLSNEPPMFVGLVRPASHWQTPGEANLAAFEQIARAVNTPLADVPGPDDTTPVGEAVDIAAIEAEAAEADRIAYRGRPFLGQAPAQAATHGEAGEAPQAATAGRDWRGEIDQLGPAFADVWRLVRELRDWILRNHEAPDAVRAAAGWLMDLVRQRDGVARRLHDLEQAAATALEVSSRRWNAIVQGLRAEIVHRKATEADLRAEASQWRATYGEHALRDATRIIAERDAARRQLEQLRGPLDWLVRLHDGPRDEQYERDKPNAWQAARTALAATAPATQDGAAS